EGQARNHPQADAHYHEALEAGVVTAELYNNLGYHRSQRLGGLHDARKYLKEAIRLNPQLPTAYHNLAPVELPDAHHLSQLRPPPTPSARRLSLSPATPGRGSRPSRKRSSWARPAANSTTTRPCCAPLPPRRGTPRGSPGSTTSRRQSSTARTRARSGWTST